MSASESRSFDCKFKVGFTAYAIDKLFDSRELFLEYCTVAAVPAENVPAVDDKVTLWLVSRTSYKTHQCSEIQNSQMKKSTSIRTRVLIRATAGERLIEESNTRQSAKALIQAAAKRGWSLSQQTAYRALKEAAGSRSVVAAASSSSAFDSMRFCETVVNLQSVRNRR